MNLMFALMCMMFMFFTEAGSSHVPHKPTMKTVALQGIFVNIPRCATKKLPCESTLAWRWRSCMDCGDYACESTLE